MIMTLNLNLSVILIRMSTFMTESIKHEDIKM